jgi:D-arginine dehydrogenase
MTLETDVLIIGGGLAGVSLAAALADSRRVMLIERELMLGTHTTGRSAALFMESYGKEPVRALTRASRHFYHVPPQGFAEHPLVNPRDVLHVATAEQVDALEAMSTRDDLAAAPWLDTTTLHTRCPILRPDHFVAGLLEHGCLDIDVASAQFGFTRQLRAAGGTIVTDRRIDAIEPGVGGWTIVTDQGRMSASVVVNAAGAWADEVAHLAGVAPLGLEPKLRTALTVEAPAGADISEWPMVIDVEESFYFKPDAGRLLLSPADELDSPPCDAQPDDFQVALAIHRFEEATGIAVHRPLSRWAGLRTFAPDRVPVIGFDTSVRGFFWLAGQGGYGIQAAPGIAALARALILDVPLPSDLVEAGVDPTSLSPARFAARAR